MKRNILIAFMVCTATLLCACTSEGGKQVLFEDSGEAADARLEQILELLENNDQEGLKAVFSEQALSEIENFDAQANNLFNFFQGTVDEWERTGLTGSDDVDNGEKTSKVISWYNVTTSQAAYVFFMIDHSVDTLTPENVGLYTLYVVDKEKEDEQLTSWQDMETAGIYVP